MESSDGSCLGNIPITGNIDMDIRELRWPGIFHGPQGLTPNDQGKHVLGPLLGLANLNCSPFIDGRLLCPEKLPNGGLPIESSADVDSTGLVDPEGGSLVSNVPTLAAYGHLHDLRVASVVVAFGVEFEGDSPLPGEGGEGCQEGVPFQQMFPRKSEGRRPIE